LYIAALKFSKRGLAKTGYEGQGINRKVTSARDKLFYGAKSAVEVFNQSGIEKCANTLFDICSSIDAVARSANKWG
jgi:hypothetical protein